MKETDRDTSGRFTGSIDDADVIAAVRAHDPAATSEIGEELGISRQGADRRLRSLRDAGDVSSKKIGASLVWFIPRDRGRRETGEDAARADAVDDATDAPADPPADTHGADAGAEEDALADTVDAVAEDVLPGSGSKLEARRDALHAAVEYLREHGTATPSDFQTDVYPTHTGRYTDGDDPARSWWKNCVYKGLRELAERTDLVEKADTTGEWSWRGEST